MSIKFLIKLKLLICYNKNDILVFYSIRTNQKNLFLIKGENMRKIFYILIVLLFVTSCTSVNSGGGSSSGKASWYGNEFNGRATASGEKFSSNKLTAAHRSLPFGSIIEVTNLENNKKVKVKVNDRGPFVSGRVLDLSEGAFSKIANKNEGVINVKIRVLKSGE